MHFLRQFISGRFALFGLLVLGTVLGLAGTDLVLPAIPGLPEVLVGSVEQSQLVLASFVAGAAIGLILFGELGARFDQRYLLLLAITLYACTSLAATNVSSISELIGWRFVQGLVSSAPAVFAPGIIKALFNEQGALRAIGLMGSIESLTPAFAPVLGAWLLTLGDWRLSFWLTAILSLGLAVLLFAFAKSLPIPAIREHRGSYMSLLRNREYLRQTLSHACTLGGLLVFVFGAPSVILLSMNGELSDFIIMQVVGISLFIVSANLSHRLVAKFGREAMILFGSLVSALGAIGILLFALWGNNDAIWLCLLFAPVNLGLGLRGPPGFHQAVIAAGDNDSRGSALLILCILAVASIGTTIVAPVINIGLVPLAFATACICCTSVIIFILARE